jgi:hypothetical protein
MHGSVQHVTANSSIWSARTRRTWRAGFISLTDRPVTLLALIVRLGSAGMSQSPKGWLMRRFFLMPHLFRHELYYLNSRTNSHHHIHTHSSTQARLTLYTLYEESCTWLKGIWSLPGFEYDGHIILTIVAHPRVRQRNLFRELLFLVGNHASERVRTVTGGLLDGSAHHPSYARFHWWGESTKADISNHLTLSFHIFSVYINYCSGFPSRQEINNKACLLEQTHPLLLTCW